MRSAAGSTAIIPYQAPLFGARAVVAPSKKRAFKWLCRRLDVPRITVNELVWLADNKEGFYGEFKRKPVTDAVTDDELARLRKHIASIVQFAADHHRSTERSKYHVTRLSMPEYSLFTSAPFNEMQLTELSDWLEKQAAELPENVHVLLSTIAVKMDDELYNMAFYITGGADARVHSVIKSQPSEEDLTYEDPDVTLFQMLPGKPDDVRFTIAHGQLSNTKALANHPGFNVAVGDTQMQVFVEICYDQPDGTALKHLEHTLRDSTLHMPRYSSNIVSANTTDICHDACITPQVTHVDAIKSKYNPRYHGNHYLITASNPAFGGPYRIYDFGTQVCCELSAEYECARRRSNLYYYQQKLGVTLSDLDITIEIDRALRAGEAQNALHLLQLLESPEPILVTRLASHHLAELPSLELNMMAMRAEKLADAQVAILAQRAGELSATSLQYLFKLVEDGFIINSPGVINLLCQQVYRLSSNAYMPFFEPEFLVHLTADSINACIKHFSDLYPDELDQITQRLFTAVNRTTQHELIARSWLLNTDSIQIICDQHETLTPSEINVLCQQAKRLSDDSLSQLLIHSDVFNSKSKLLLDNEIAARSRQSSALRMS
ncbi:MAG: hypothetical protein P1U40_12760 [Coxiellaceae bacterium]|nr:hypothetical protein [Coxiellaceae bacterium]